MNLTAGQSAVLECIKEHVDKHGYPPTTREIGKKVGYASSSTIHRHLENLRRKGYVDWVDGSSRTLKVVKVPE